MRLLSLAIFTLAALPLAAATRYSIAVDEAGRFRSHLDATVLADGKQRRVDVVREVVPFVYDVLLSDDGGATFTALNTALKTWFRYNSTSLRPRLHVYLTTPNVQRRSFRNVVVTPSDEPPEPIDGFAAHKYVIKTSFAIRESIGGTPVDEDYGATILIWTTDAIDAAFAVRAVDLTTGFADVDALLVPALAKIPGFPLKTTISATRAFTGGRPQTFIIIATVSDIRTVAAPPHAFERPAGYINQEPLIGAPGR